MQQAEIIELFRPILQQSAQRRRITDYAAAALFVLVVGLIVYSGWRNGQVPKIESVALVPNSIVMIGPADGVNENGRLEFCPGDLFTVRYALAIEGDGVIYADDAAHFQNQTVKFSALWRDIVETSTRMYENAWLIPARPDMAIDGERAWVAGQYTRVISVAASNIYISRYVPPVTFEVPFRIGEDCP